MSQVQEFKQDNMDNKVPDFVIFLCEGWIPVLDSHIAGEQKIDGLFFSELMRAFLCSKRTFEKIDAEYGITKKLTEEGLEDEIFHNIDSFIDVAIGGETITVSPSIGAPIELELTEWGMWFSYEKLKDFDVKSDWGAELLQHIKVTALDIFVDTMTEAAEEMQKQIKKE